jgi:hypothetical protein
MTLISAATYCRHKERKRQMGIFRNKQHYLCAAALLLAGTAGWAVASASPAEACSVSSHCYGVTTGSASGIDGDYVFITPSCLSTPSGNFVTDELWLVNSSAAYWVEVGYLQLGSGLNVGGIATAGRYGFWADSRPGGGFHAHVLQNNPSLSAGAPAEIYKVNSSTWETYFNGHFGQSTSNSFTPAFGEWGSETTSASAHSMHTGTTAEYETGSSFHSGVPNPSWGSSSPQTFSWTTRYTNYKAGVPC